MMSSCAVLKSLNDTKLNFLMITFLATRCQHERGHIDDVVAHEL